MHTLWYHYDQQGLCAVECNGVVYHVKKNLQGDVVMLLNSEGDAVARYVYDAWGNHKVYDGITGNVIYDSNNYSPGSGVTYGYEDHIGVLNPFRYRSYYYDTETRYYYLQTRYYDPQVGRFINADAVDYADPQSLNGLNLYAYCGNDPVNSVDPGGNFVSTILGAAFGGLWGGILAAKQGKSFWKGAAVGAVTGALAGLAVDVGLATGGVGGIVLAGTLGFVAGFYGDIAGQMIVDEKKGYEVDLGQALASGVFTAVVNVATFGIGVLASKATEAVKPTGNIFAKVAKSVLPKYTPGSSWFIQASLGKILPFFPMLPGLICNREKQEQEPV
ncbi:MAG: hypothetical protein FWD58_06055 [Firmicutes bacterium]|nr:hypothetical protein [Bacillota bacterium]